MAARTPPPALLQPQIPQNPHPCFTLRSDGHDCGRQDKTSTWMCVEIEALFSALNITYIVDCDCDCDLVMSQ